MSSAPVMTKETNMIHFPHKTSIRSKHEREAELSLLCSLIERIRTRSACGDDNIAALDSQIEVLSRRKTPEQIEGDFGNEPDYITSAALNAVEWLWDQGEAPSDGWARMLGEGPDGQRVN